MEGFELATFGQTTDQEGVEEHDEDAAIENTPNRRSSVSSLPLPSPTKVKTTRRPTSTPPFCSPPLVRPSRSVIISAQANNPPAYPPPNPPSTAITLLTPIPPTAAFIPVNIPRSLYSFTPFFPPQHAYMQFPHPNIPAVAVYVQLWSNLPPTTGPGRLYRQYVRRHAGPVRRWAWRNRAPLWCLTILLGVIGIFGLLMTVIVVSLQHAGILDKKGLLINGTGTETTQGIVLGPWG
jgi:hypothetical protein